MRHQIVNINLIYKQPMLLNLKWLRLVFLTKVSLFYWMSIERWKYTNRLDWIDSLVFSRPTIWIDSRKIISLRCLTNYEKGKTVFEFAFVLWNFAFTNGSIREHKRKKWWKIPNSLNTLCFGSEQTKEYPTIESMERVSTINDDI